MAQIRKATKPQERVYAYHWLVRTLEFMSGFTVLGYDAHAEARFQSLLSQKIRIGTQDLKIAAIALSKGATTVKKTVDNLAVESPLSKPCVRLRRALPSRINISVRPIDPQHGRKSLQVASLELSPDIQHLF